MDILGHRKTSDLSNSVDSIKKIYAIQKPQKVLYLRFKHISQKSSIHDIFKADAIDMETVKLNNININFQLENND